MNPVNGSSFGRAGGRLRRYLPMRNSRKAIVYYLFFASPKAVAEKIITDIFGKYGATR